MDVRVIRNEADYRAALADIEQYFIRVPEKGTPEAERFDLLTILVEAYENEVWPIEDLDPVDMILGYMEMKNQGQADLAKVLGSRSHASEVIRRKRRLSLDMIQKLSTTWKIPADALVKPYKIAGEDEAA